jgi:predicted permease
MSKEDLIDLQDLPAFEAVVGFSPTTTVLTGRGSAALIQGTRVTSGILEAFGLEPFLGRDLHLEESYPGHPHVVVVSHGFWMSDLGGDPEVLGTTLELQGEPYEIVGVAPPDFDYPRQARLWFPFVMDPESCARGCHSYMVIGRIADGVPNEAAAAQAGSLGDQLADAFPDSNLEKRFNVTSLVDRTVGDVRQSLWILLGAVGLVLLVACANVANLLLVRGQNRLGEIGVRAALGARRGRIVLLILTESLVLAVAGGAAGLALAFGGVRLVRRFAEGAVPRLEEVSVDPGVVLFTLGMVLFVTALFGLLPALHASGTSPAVAMGRSRQLGALGRRTGRARSALLAGEMALSVVLLVGAGLLLRTLGQLNQVDPGFETENTLRFDLVLPDAAYPELPAITQFYDGLLDRIDRIPGVVSAGAGYGAPYGGWGISGDVLVEGRPEPGPGEANGSQVRSVTAGYLETLGVQPIRGRGILASDDTGAEPVAVVNETFVRQNFPDRDPMGERFRVTISHGFGSPVWTIVGVVPDVRSFSLTGRAGPEAFVPLAQSGPGRMTVVVRSGPDAGPALPQVREIVHAMDPDVPLRGVTTMEAVVREETASTRFLLGLLTVFSGLALVLAAVGLSGVVSYLVSQRRQEIGIRLALGANRKSVVRLVLEQAARPVTVGVAMGLVVSLAGARIMESLLFEVSPRDPLVLLGVVAVLILTTVVSAVFPARRAGSIDPVRALASD